MLATHATGIPRSCRTDLLGADMGLNPNGISANQVAPKVACWVQGYLPRCPRLTWQCLSPQLKARGFPRKTHASIVAAVLETKSEWCALARHALHASRIHNAYLFIFAVTLSQGGLLLAFHVNSCSCGVLLFVSCMDIHKLRISTSKNIFWRNMGKTKPPLAATGASR